MKFDRLLKSSRGISPWFALTAPSSASKRRGCRAAGRGPRGCPRPARSRGSFLARERGLVISRQEAGMKKARELPAPGCVSLGWRPKPSIPAVPAGEGPIPDGHPRGHREPGRRCGHLPSPSCPPWRARLKSRTASPASQHRPNVSAQVGLHGTGSRRGGGGPGREAPAFWKMHPRTPKAGDSSERRTLEPPRADGRPGTAARRSAPPPVAPAPLHPLRAQVSGRTGFEAGSGSRMQISTEAGRAAAQKLPAGGESTAEKPLYSEQKPRSPEKAATNWAAFSFSPPS